MTRFAIAVAAIAALLAGCSTRSPAPVSDRRPAPATQPRPPVAQQAPVPATGAPAAAATAGTYVVKRGDTLYSIALEHGADYRELAQLNKIDDPSRIRVGQELRLSPPHEHTSVQVGSTRTSGPIESRPLGSASAGPAPAAPAVVDGAMKTSPKALRLPYSEQNVALLQKGETPPAAQVASTAPKPPAGEAKPPAVAPADRDPDAIEFAWPAKGRLLAGFSEPNNKGLDIAGKPGDPVLAAAPGRVMYTGTGIRGYGKLIVIKHDNNFNSVYAHNREILVKEGQNVLRGQRIAELGDTDADAPKLHFEIRKSGKPVDPARYLPAP
jgi:lipoprotein NlpD